MRAILILIWFWYALQASAQLPETDIWLFKVEQKENRVLLSKPLNITNREGYDNQPCFTPDGKSLLFVSVDSSGQADVYQYSISKKKIINLTRSEVSEYSPSIIPNCGGFSAVVVEKDSAQRLWHFNMDGSFKQIISEITDSVGYYTWLNQDSLLYYKLTQPHSLRALNIKNQSDVWICDNPGRAFKQLPQDSKFVYAIKDSLSLIFRIYDPTLKESRVYAMLEGIHEDFIWHASFGLTVARNSELIHYNDVTKQWEVLCDLAPSGIKKITRFAFDHKSRHLAIVGSI
ncbi:MAG: hypothetical protein K0R26_2792 [Bacteroidota bacterium]|nr:hypothetical protein [Bacteroidota bacterium]